MKKISEKTEWTGWDIVESVVPWSFVCLMAFVFNTIADLSNNGKIIAKNLIVYILIMGVTVFLGIFVPFFV